MTEQQAMHSMVPAAAAVVVVAALTVECMEGQPGQMGQ